MKIFKTLLFFIIISSAFTACQKELSFENTTPSVGTLKSDNADNCLPSTVNGGFFVDTVLNAGNYIEVTVNVTTPGLYTILTDTLNGYYFKGTGAFASAGSNIVKLMGIGKPIASGTDIFHIIYLTDTCNVEINVLQGISGDYFPLTQNSWWSYTVNDPFFPGDSLKVHSDNLSAINGNNYRIFQVGPDESVEDSAYNRKSGTEYYQRIDAADFSSLSFDEPQDTAIMFLNEALPQGTSWPIEFLGNIGGQPSKIRYTYTMEAFNANNVLINGVTYNNVHKVKLLSEVNINNGGYTPDLTFEFYYAKGIGLIHLKAWQVANPIFFYLQDIKHYQVF